MEGGPYVLLLLVSAFRGPALAAPVFDDYPACVAAGKEAEKKFTRPDTTMVPGTTVKWFCSQQSSDPRRE